MARVLLAVLLVLTACSAGSARPTQPATIQVSTSNCGRGWTDAKAGHQDLLLRNTDVAPGEVTLTDARTGAVYAYVESLGPGGTATMSVDLTGGRYAFRCAMQDADVVTGPTVSVTGTARVVLPAVLPVTQQQLIGPTKEYETYVAARLPGLATLVDRLRDDIAHGDLAPARADWLPAHLAYERLGAAYGAFGDADERANGIAGRTGFHRIEYGLWHGQPAAALRPFADDLAKAVSALRTTFARAQLDPAQVAIRAHEITENALQFELTGRTDYGSGSNLATVGANLDGTGTVLDVLRPLLVPRYPTLPRLDRQLAQARHAVSAATGTPLARLSRIQRETIDADVGELAELLAPVAAICEPRRTS